ncbi:hypothetical protein THASP1DRAFT_30241 [Thamnocephalis sphaerospora]|uniref:F-box domain-containing protein n=1 Tax=Thamnocephalis sphaerospora TaxID=78915 RepID=A0A4P9XPX2_9FUNG|nr:hypothetical protein THASP1DRAFT_30241 [Thamnocephalis sphaerospora]|eukprot:RKP07942.1 hypothetical protein THASP1DRAFT_30241 [Thamnocephalis sphaerospora]
MEYIPNEVFDCIIEATGDEAALVALSCTSKQLRIRVSCRQKLWSERFKQHFSQNDGNEQGWLRQYKRAYQNEACSGSIACESSTSPTGHGLDWFDIYCRRRATEYRWRQGQHSVHQLARTVGVRPHGIRIQSSPFSYSGLSPDDALVASEWLLMPQRQSTWVLEQLCWGSVKIERMEIRGQWHSDEYLALQTWDKSSRRYSVYAWGFAALHKPPCVVVYNKEQLHDMHIHRNWFWGCYELSKESKQWVTFAYNLAKGEYCLDILGGFTRCCILRATTDCIYIVWVGLDWHTVGPIMVTYKLWQIAPGQSASFQCQATGQMVMNRDGFVKPQRIDDTRVALWSSYFDEPEATSPPTLVLLEIASDTAKVTLKEAWSHAIEVSEVRAITSRNLLGIRRMSESVTLLDINSGAEVRRIHLDCWEYSGLYPSSDLWTRMAENATWLDPRNGTIPDIDADAKQVALPTALLYNKGSTFIVVDYAKRPLQAKQTDRPSVPQIQHGASSLVVQPQQLKQNRPSLPRRLRSRLFRAIDRLADRFQ